jgi:hypothetical protein
MSAASVAVAAAETSHVPANADRIGAAERPVVTSAQVMVLPGMVDREARSVAARVDWPSIGIGGIAIAGIAIVAISRLATSADPTEE